MTKHHHCLEKAQSLRALVPIWVRSAHRGVAQPFYHCWSTITRKHTFVLPLPHSSDGFRWLTPRITTNTHRPSFSSLHLNCCSHKRYSILYKGFPRSFECIATLQKSLISACFCEMHAALSKSGQRAVISQHHQQNRGPPLPLPLQGQANHVTDIAQASVCIKFVHFYGCMH